MRLIATILFIIQVMFIPMPPTVWVPSAEYLGWENYTATIPDDYYDRQCIIPIGMSVETWLTKLEWPLPLEHDVWDCSDTSAYTEWVLENCGYEAEIVTIMMKSYGHAFVRVKLDGRWREYEATSREWLPKIMGRLPKTVFPNLHHLWHFMMYDTLGFGREWTWWER